MRKANEIQTSITPRVTIKFPKALEGLLKKHVGEDLEKQYYAWTISELIGNSVADFPELKERFFPRNDSTFSRFINIYLNDKDIRFKDNLETKLTDGDYILLQAAISGGAPY